MTNQSKPIITVRGLSKTYDISHRLRRNEHPTLRDDIVHAVRKPLELIGAAGGTTKEEFWALNNIQFDIYPGDVVGVMGPNGSGKSTLFKILSRVTQPTTGKIVINGRTASLLEVGTGFHQELTGRENVYFNGAILGMSKKEIEQKFDEIVAFSEIEKFIDTPVKFYSSGMKVRLAFSVAAFLRPEILIIDEVLAVGDVKFKEKSLRHMQSIAAGGTTILFVSHIVSQFKKICDRGIVLDHGHLILDSDLDTAIDKYLELNAPDEEEGKEVVGESSGDLLVKDFEIVCDSKKDSGARIKFDFSVENLTNKTLNNVRLSLMIADMLNRNVALLDNGQIHKGISFSSGKKSSISINITDVPLVPGEYKLRLNIADKDDPSLIYHRVVDGLIFDVPEYDFYKLDPAQTNRQASSIALNFTIDTD